MHSKGARSGSQVTADILSPEEEKVIPRAGISRRIITTTAGDVRRRGVLSSFLKLPEWKKKTRNVTFFESLSLLRVSICLSLSVANTSEFTFQICDPGTRKPKVLLEENHFP